MPDAALQLAVATALGLLVGLQREWSKGFFVGVRTFPLITMLGAVMAMLSGQYGGWLVGAGLLAVAGALFVGDAARLAQDKNVGGMTTEFAALVMYGVGALCVGETLWVALIVAGAVLGLLQYKAPLHDLVGAVRGAELKAVVQLALVGLVVLPVMPDRVMGPYQVVNPRHAWTMVVLIVGISLAGHGARRMLGQRSGLVVSGLLGGLVSSTATTVSEARRTGPGELAASGVIVVLAAVVSFARLLFEIGVAAPGLLPAAGPPLGILLGVGVVSGVAMSWWVGRRDHTPPEAEDATDLVGAVVFGLLYAAVLVGVAWTQDQFGEDALYVVGFISGLTDVDAITLSTSHLAVEGQVDHAVAWRVVTVAAMSNTLFKLGIAGALGGWGMAWRVAAALTPTVVTAGVLFWAWPG